MNKMSLRKHNFLQPHKGRITGSRCVFMEFSSWLLKAFVKERSAGAATVTVPSECSSFPVNNPAGETCWRPQPRGPAATPGCGDPAQARGACSGLRHRWSWDPMIKLNYSLYGNHCVPCLRSAPTILPSR